MSYPKFLFHKDKAPLHVYDAEAEADARAIGYGSDYQHKEYPKDLYKGDAEKLERKRVVDPAEEEAAIEEGYREDIDPRYPLASDSRFKR